VQAIAFQWNNALNADECHSALTLLQRRDRLQRVAAARQFPVAAQLVTMEHRPFERQTKNSGRKFAPENSQRFNFNERLMLCPS
jgi:hypothetical protein